MMIIAHGGSSSPGLYISHTGVVGAPYSGQTHPGHPASLEAAGDTERGPIMRHTKKPRRQAANKQCKTSEFCKQFIWQIYAKLIWPQTPLQNSLQTRRALNTISCRDMAMHHQLWKLAERLYNTVLEKKRSIMHLFDHRDLYGNISIGFLGIIIRDKGNLPGPARLEVIFTVHLEILIGRLFFLVGAFLINLYLFQRV